MGQSEPEREASMATNLRSMWGILAGAGIALVAAGCGTQVVSGEGGGSSTSTTTAATCPADHPQQGAPCDCPGVTCSYGNSYCPAVYTCVGGTWAAAGDCPQPVCPPEVPSGGEACAHPEQVCDYSAPCSGQTATCHDGIWEVMGWAVGCAEMCPADIPAPGTPCDGCCAGGPCDYPTPDGCGATAHCSGGTWAVFVSDCPPPPADPCLMFSSSNACAANPACRWLTPGCGEPPLPFAGCYDAFDCKDDASCLFGYTCLAVTYNPCWDSPCNACGASANVCVPINDG